MPDPNTDVVINPDQEAVATDEDAQASQDTDGTDSTAPVGTASDGIDWKARALQFEEAFKGLQGTVQQLVEAQRGTAQLSAAREEERLKAEFTRSLEGLTENEAAFAKKAFDLELENRRLKADKEANEPLNQRLAKDAIMNKLAKDYGVAPAFLEQMVQKYNHPLALAAAAEAAHATRKQFERPKENAKVEASTGGSTGGDEAQLAALANSGNFDAYWKLIDRQADREARRGR